MFPKFVCKSIVFLLAYNDKLKIKNIIFHFHLFSSAPLILNVANNGKLKIALFFIFGFYLINILVISSFAPEHHLLPFLLSLCWCLCRRRCVWRVNHTAVTLSSGRGQRPEDREGGRTEIPQTMEPLIRFWDRNRNRTRPRCNTFYEKRLMDGRSVGQTTFVEVCEKWTRATGQLDEVEEG